MLRPFNNFLVLRSIAIPLVIGCAAISGCSLNTDVAGPGGLIKYSGDQQTAATNTELPTPLGVLVVTQFGERLKNTPVNWTIVAGGGSLSSAVTLSDDSGIASVIYTTGAVAGAAIIRAQVHGVPYLTFNITIT